MEFKKAMRTVNRICETAGSCNRCKLLGNCPFVTIPSNIDINKIESIIAKWLEGHPERTISDDFYEKFPKAPLKEDGTPEACARWLGYCNNCRDENGETLECSACWRRPLEEV